MSGLATNYITPLKRSKKRKDDGTTTNGSAVGSGSATPMTAKTTGNNNNVKATTLPLQAAPLSMKVGIALLPIASHPFLTPLCKNILRTGSNYYYALNKVMETKSTKNYVASPTRKLNI